MSTGTFVARVPVFAPGFPWVPATVPGLIAWLDLADVSSLYQDNTLATAITADAQTVGGVREKSGYSRNATEGSGSYEPTYKTAIQNGRSILRWGGLHNLSIANAGIDVTDLTIFAVVRTTATSVFILDKWNNAFSPNRYPYNLGIDGTGHGSFAAYDGTTGVGAQTTAAINDGAGHILTGVRSAGLIKAYADGTLGGSVTDTIVGNTTANGLGLGIGLRSGFGSNGYTGDLGELLMYSPAVIEADRIRIEAYLRYKWATP